MYTYTLDHLCITIITNIYKLVIMRNCYIYNFRTAVDK